MPRIKWSQHVGFTRIDRDGAAGPRPAEWTCDLWAASSSAAMKHLPRPTAMTRRASFAPTSCGRSGDPIHEDDGVTPRISLRAVVPAIPARPASPPSREAVTTCAKNPAAGTPRRGARGPARTSPRRCTCRVDATGDSANHRKFVDGEMAIWHDTAPTQVMTNEPTFDRQLAILEYWGRGNPREFPCPARCAPSDRFRCGRSSYLNSVVQTSDPPHRPPLRSSSVFESGQTSVPWGHLHRPTSPEPVH